MNLLDLALASLLVLCALRGFWRGWIRELFGFAAFVVGVATALRLTADVAASTEGIAVIAALPDSARIGGIFVGLFLIASAIVNLAGFVFDRIAGGGFMRWVGGIAGGLFGVMKGAAVLSFVLLFIQLFPVFGEIETQLAGSRMARPMIAAADGVLRGRWVAVGNAGEPA